MDRAPNATIDRLAAAYILADELIQSFENYDVAHAPLRSTDGPGTIFQLLVDVRSFQINTDSDLTAEIGLSARILNKGGQVVASHLFQQRRKLDKPDPASAVGAFDDAFGSIATELIRWTAGALLALPDQSAANELWRRDASQETSKSAVILGHDPD